MPWVRLDDRIDENPKIVRAGPLALALYVAGLAYCNRNLTDGFIPTGKAQRLLDWHLEDTVGNEWALAYVGNGQDAPATVNSTSVLNTLVEYGLWDRVPGGYRIHDYEEYQPTKAKVQADRAATSERVQRYRARRNGVTNGVRNGDGNADVPGTGTGNNLESSDDAGWTPTGQADDPFVTAHAMTGRVPTGRLADWLNEMGRDHGDKAVSDELERQAGGITLADPKALHELIKRTSEALKLAAVVRNRTKPQAPQPEPRRPATPEELLRAKVQRRAVRLWLEAGGPGSGKTADEFMEQAKGEVSE